MEIAERFWPKVTVAGPDDCWPYTGFLDRGYGQFWINDERRNLPAHRVAYGLTHPGFVGDLDHLCHTNDLTCRGGPTCGHRACCNPRHLEPVTRGANSARGKLRLTQCARGHDYTSENTRITKEGWRVCRACNRDRLTA